jgi:hypothetical protein
MKNGGQFSFDTAEAVAAGDGDPSSTRIFFFGPSAPGCMPSPGSCSQVVPPPRVSSGYSNASSAPIGPTAS